MANKKVSQLTSKPSVLTTDLFPIADPSTGQLFKTTISDLGTAIGSGVSSVNSLVGAVVLDTDDIQELASPTNKWFTDTRARAALSASSPLTYNSGTGAFGIQVATGSQNGYLSSTDWTTFNAKQAALSGTGFVKSTGGTISYDTNTYLTTSAAASTYLALGGGTMTGALIGTSAGFTGYVGIGNTSPLYQLDVTGSGRFEGDLHILSTNPRIYLTDSDNNPDYFISNTDGTFTVYDVTNSTSRFTIGTTGNATFANAITGGGSITGQSLYSNGIISAGTSLSVGTFVSAGGSLTGSALYVTGMTAGSGALYYNSGANRVTVANYNASGIVTFEVNGGNTALTLNSNLSATFAGALSGTSATFSSSVTANNTITAIGTSTAGFVTSLLVKNPSTNAASAVKIGFDGGGTTWGEIGASYNSNSPYMAFFVRANSEKMRITDAGNVGIGTTAPANYTNYITQTINGANGAIVQLQSSGTPSLRLIGEGTDAYIDNLASGGALLFRTNNATERMRITSGGNVLIGTTSNTAASINTTKTLQVNNEIMSVGSAAGIFWENRSTPATTSANWYGWYTTSGTIFLYNGVANVASISPSTGVYTPLSDRNKKKDFEVSNIGLSEIMQLKPTLYRMKSDESEGLKELGFIAQDVKEFIPNAYVESDEFIGLNYNPIVAALTKAVQELKAELDTLKNK